MLPLGNLQSRTDTRQDLGETFQYDNLNRVIQVDTTTGVSSGGTTDTVTMTYLANGNIASKSDVGTYTYGEVHATCTSGNAGPHALSTVAGTKNATYCYDANGNMTDGDSRVVAYAAFDKPTLITKGTSIVAFSYGPDRARFKRVDTTLSGVTTTIYAGGKAYEKIDTNGAISEKHYVGGFAVITRVASTDTESYMHHDHLGSVDTITDAAGLVTQRMSFDAWGQRREVNWQPMVESARLNFNTTLTTRGFTNHEQIDSVGLVHMNGRVYDAELGRFLSADPHVQDPSNLQSWNRYSYVLNNPLSFTDPSGFFFKGLFKAIGNFVKKAFKAIGNIVKKALANPIVRGIIQIVGCAATGPAGCVAISAALTAATGGSLTDVIQAAAFSFASMGAFTVAGEIVSSLAADVISGLKLVGDAAFAAGTAIKAGVHGIVGGALSAAQGGSFQEGFIGSAIGAVGGAFAGESGYFGKYGDKNFANMVGRAAISGAAGCAGAMLAGGKCATGAVTAAFASLFNGERMLQCIAAIGAGCVTGGQTGAMAVGGAACIAGNLTCPLTGTAGAAAGVTVGCIVGGAVGAYSPMCGSSSPSGGNNIFMADRLPGFWPGDRGAEEWGHRNGIGKDAGRRRFHDIKQGDTVHSGGKADWTVNPDSGDVADPDNEIMGNLDE